MSDLLMFTEDDLLHAVLGEWSRIKEAASRDQPLAVAVAIRGGDGIRNVSDFSDNEVPVGIAIEQLLIKWSEDRKQYTFDDDESIAAFVMSESCERELRETLDEIRKRQ